MWTELIKDLNQVMTYQQIANELGMSRSSVWELEHGKSRQPMAKTYLALVELHKKNSRAIGRAKRLLGENS